MVSALVAYPAEHGVSGIMTFMVNQQGVVYERDLGPKTAEGAGRWQNMILKKTWEKVQQASTATGR